MMRLYTSALATGGAGKLLAGQIAVVLADGIGGGERVVGELVILGDFAHQICRCFPAGQLLAQEGVENRAGGVAGLKPVLNVQCLEYIFGVADGQVRAVGIVGVPPGSAAVMISG